MSRQNSNYRLEISIDRSLENLNPPGNCQQNPPKFRQQSSKSPTHMSAERPGQTGGLGYGSRAPKPGHIKAGRPDVNLEVGGVLRGNTIRGNRPERF